jgi:3-oxoacyl-[acyl-carrier protein] reductase
MKSLAGELKQRGVKVNAISPGMMDTKFTQNVHRIIKEKYIKESIHGRLVTPDEVALRIEKLLDSEVTGENILVPGKRIS